MPPDDDEAAESESSAEAGVVVAVDVDAWMRTCLHSEHWKDDHSFNKVHFGQLTYVGMGFGRVHESATLVLVCAWTNSSRLNSSLRYPSMDETCGGNVRSVYRPSAVNPRGSGEGEHDANETEEEGGEEEKEEEEDEGKEDEEMEENVGTEVWLSVALRTASSVSANGVSVHAGEEAEDDRDNVANRDIGLKGLLCGLLPPDAAAMAAKKTSASRTV